MQQSAMRSHTISAVEVLWNEILTLQGKFTNLLVVDTVMTPGGIQTFFEKGARGRGGDLFAEYRDFNRVTEKMSQVNEPALEKARLFTGERLWLLFVTIRGVYVRYLVLIHQSLRKSRYHDWRKDRLMMGHLSNCLTDERQEEAKSAAIGGLQVALNYLKADFLREAVRVMSGSQHIAESLADFQSTIITEKQRLDMARAVGTP